MPGLNTWYSCDIAYIKDFVTAFRPSGYDGDKRGCGVCADDYSGTCETCKEDNCNEKMELVDAYKCYTYTYDEKTKKVSEPSDKNEEQCKLKKGDDKTEKTCVK